jgi:hypothetical protein
VPEHPAGAARCQGRPARRFCRFTPPAKARAQVSLVENDVRGVQLIGTPTTTDEASEFVAADAPPTLASSVHFLRAALLMDLRARCRGAAAVSAAPTDAALSR